MQYKKIFLPILATILSVIFVGIGNAQANDPNAMQDSSSFDAIIDCPNISVSIIAVDLAFPASICMYDESGNLLEQSPMFSSGENVEWAVKSEKIERCTILELKNDKGERVSIAEKSEVFHLNSRYPSAFFFVNAKWSSPDHNKAQYTGSFGFIDRIPVEYKDPAVVIAIKRNGQTTTMRLPVVPGEIYTWKHDGIIDIGDSICIIVLDDGVIKKVNKVKTGFNWGIVLDIIEVNKRSPGIAYLVSIA